MSDGMAQSPHRRSTVPVAHRGTILNVVSWVLLAIMLCVLVVRFAMKLFFKTRRRKVGLDDFFIALAALFSFAQTIAVSLESTRSLGKHILNLNAKQIDVYQKTEYASCILYIANLGCAKISMWIVIRKILPGVVAKYTALVSASFTAVWTISGIIANAFPCNLPTPWTFIEPEKCYNLVAFVNYIGITNIIIETLMVILPLFIWNVRLSTAKCVSISVLFLSRLSVVAAVSAKLYFLNMSTPTDFPYSSWAVVVCQQVAQNLSVITACLPCLHPFIVSILIGATEPESIKLSNAPPFMRQYLDKKSMSSHPRISHASDTPPTQYEEYAPYCHPLATYGLDGSPPHVRSNLGSRLLANIAMPVVTAKPKSKLKPKSKPETFFNRRIDFDEPTSSCNTVKPNNHEREAAKDWSDVGVLPNIDWDDSGSVASSQSNKNSSSRTPTAEYIFDRANVISVAEGYQSYDVGVERFTPPLPSPVMPERPPQAF